MELVSKFVVKKFDERDGYVRYLYVERFYDSENDRYVVKPKGIKNWSKFRKAFPEIKIELEIDLEDYKSNIALYHQVPFYEKEDMISWRNRV